MHGSHHTQHLYRPYEGVISMSNWLKLEGEVCAVTGALGGMGTGFVASLPKTVQA